MTTLEKFQAGPQTTTADRIVIEMPNGKLPVGAHKFGLTVVDDSGNQSAQMAITVVIVDLENPTAVVEVRDADGRPVTGNRIPFGASFLLSGKLSADAGGGRIASYSWELL